MDAAFQRRIQRYGWDKASDAYERYWSEQIAPSQQLLLEMAELRPGERVLDVACGTGLLSIPAAEAAGPNGGVTGIDISDVMVAASARRAAQLEVTNTSFRRMGAEELRFRDGSFDAVLCALGLMYVPEPLTALREQLRVLRRGGRAAAAVWGARDRCGWAEIFPIVDRRVKTDVCPLFFQLGRGDALAIAFELAGFDDVRTRRISTLLRYDTAEAACGAAFAGGPVALAHARFDARTRAEAQAEYVASIEPFRNGRGYEIPGEFVVTMGRKS
jgi:ubiquinone/menaquinone biosynthesis C-methylase UbiE